MLVYEKAMRDTSYVILYAKSAPFFFFPYKNHNKLEDDSSRLPSKLLLTEFRSLVVSCPRSNSPTMRNTKCRGQNNFKTFRKVCI